MIIAGIRFTDKTKYVQYENTLMHFGVLSAAVELSNNFELGIRNHSANLF